ncbi:MAG TPA: malto-oligosyltrehalose synthase [Chloroflexota bacterium]
MATYRLQFNAGFQFADAQALVPYLAALGISDLYASPVLTARRGSTHGYDVADPTRISDELGGEPALAALAAALRERGMGLLLDIVPNHTAASLENPWWRDVLQNGPVSPYARYFDVDWQSARPGLENRVLLPILGAHYGEVLEKGELRLAYEDGELRVRYYDWRLPVAARTYGQVLGAGLPACLAAADAPRELAEAVERVNGDLQRLAVGTTEQFRAAAAVLWQLYQEHAAVHRGVDEAVAAYNGIPGDAASFDALDRLLGEQPYRLAYWRVASPEINYRRFFDVSDLVAMRVEDERVFAGTHESILQLVAAEQVTGLRIDHIDGLADPLAYLQRLHAALGARDYVVVEKILTGDEELPREWPIAGTTGYEFARAAVALLVDPRADAVLDALWTRVTGEPADFRAVAYRQKRKVIAELFAGDVSALATRLGALASRDRLARDLTIGELEAALVEVTAQFPVYRTYTRDFAVSAQDRGYVEAAVAAARAEQPANQPALHFLRRVLLLKMPSYLAEPDRQAWLRFVMRWQQFTGPVAAKGVEDTALYVYTRFLALNEVGSEPERPARHAGAGASGPPAGSVAAFHQWNAARTAAWPHTLNATSTHDTKRSEDVRARLAVLSELPEAWAARLERWRAWNADLRPVVQGRPVPDGSAELLLYQTLLGAWPLDDAERQDFRERLRAYLVKASREAKERTSWLHPDKEYEAALTEFADAILAPARPSPFLSDFGEMQQLVVFYGALNSLTQTLLKLTAPGVPDFYQGTELWDFSLVDPDNRRPVDFERRAALLAALEAAAHGDQSALLGDLLANWTDGRLKLYLTSQALHARRAHADLFAAGDYQPLHVTGAHREHVCAFARRQREAWAIVVAPRLGARLASVLGSEVAGGQAPGAGAADALPPLHWPLGEAAWGDTALVLPAGAPRRWHEVLSGGEIHVEAGGPGAKAAPALPLAVALRTFPLALLVGE